MTAPTPRPGIMEIAAYVGGESKAPGINRVIKLASNEGALGPSPRAMEVYRQQAGDIHRYPDGGAIDLRNALARRWGLDAARIVCGAGSDELITLLVRAYAGPGDEVLYSQHGFLMYPIAAKSAGATPVTAPESDLRTDVDALLAAVTPRTRIVLVANPNNPTGSYIPASEMRRLHAGLPPDVLLVIDAAYAEYVDLPDYTAGAELVEAADNVVMLRTFSKIFALAALRLGWGYCSPAIADVLNRVRGPFNTSVPAQAAGIAALDDQTFLDASRSHNDQWRPWLADKLTALGLSVAPSVTNFILVRFPDEKGQTADDAAEYLVKRGIIARKMGGYGLGHSLRITIGAADEVKAVADALTDFRAAKA